MSDGKIRKKKNRTVIKRVRQDVRSRMRKMTPLCLFLYLLSLCVFSLHTTTFPPVFLSALPASVCSPIMNRTQNPYLPFPAASACVKSVSQYVVCTSVTSIFQLSRCILGLTIISTIYL